MSDETNIKNSTNGPGCKRYTIPRKQRLLSEDCQRGIPLDSREAKEIINTVHHLTWESAEDFDRNFTISKIYKVENQVLEREFQTKRTELRDEGRSTKELSEHYAFKAEHYGTAVKEQCMKGLYCNDSNSVLGDGKMGVSVWKCPDLCLKTLKWPDSWTVSLIVFRIVKGKVKPVTPKQPNQDNNLEPTPNYDCHVAKNVQYSSTADNATLMLKTQYYLYEYNEEGLARDRPRHCLPFAVIHVKKAVITAQPENKLLEAIPAHLAVSEDATDAFVQDTKAKVQYLTEDDGKMAWRGLIGNKESSLGVVAIKAGHKLGLTLWKSFIDVRSKLPLNNLLKVIPGDIRTAWDKPLHYRGHTYSLCMVKPCGPADKFINFIKSLSMRDHAAGVVTVDSSTVMFFVPSSKLSVDLGFCEDEEPWRMFCIVRRRLRRYFPSDFDAQSCINTQANQPTSIEPHQLNINWKFEVPNLAKGIEELKVIIPPPRPTVLSISRSKSVDFTNTRSRNTLLRRVSDTGCRVETRPPPTSPLLATPAIKQPIVSRRQPSPQQPTLTKTATVFSTTPPPQKQLSQGTHTDATTKPNEEDLDLGHVVSKKVSLFRFDNIPFLEHTSSPPEVDNNNTTTTHNEDKHVPGGNHGDYDVIMEGADGICSFNLTTSTSKVEALDDDKYHRHRQTLVPCTNSSKITPRDKDSPIKTSPRRQESYNMTSTEPTNQDNRNDVKTPTLPPPSRDHGAPSSRDNEVPSSRDLSPRSFGVYAKHMETLKRKSSSPGSEYENVKKKKLDFGSGNDSPQDIPHEDLSSRELSAGERRDVVKEEEPWTSGLQVIELVLIEQDFQKTDEKLECLEKQNAFEILDVDSVTEITEHEATTMKQVHDVGATKAEGQLAGHSSKHKHVEENGNSAGVTRGCREMVQGHALGSRDDLDVKASGLPKAVCCTLPSVELKQQQDFINMTSQEHTNNTITRQDHTSNMASQNHTCTTSSQDRTNSTISSQDLTNNTMSSQDHTITISSQDHTSTTSSQDHTNRTSPFLNEKENYKNKPSDSAQSESKAQGSTNCVSDEHNRSIPYCYSGSSHLLYNPPPLKTRRLVTDNPCLSPRYRPPPVRSNNPPFPPLPNERFCRLPSLPFHGARRMPFPRPPLLFLPNGFPCRPPFVPRPNAAHYMCYGDRRNRVL